MKTLKQIKFIFIGLLMLLLAGCEDMVTPTPITPSTPDPNNDHRTPEYKAALRAYKKSDHQLFFGWFGGRDGWNPNNYSKQNSLRAVPDSVDIIAIFGGWLNLSQAKKDEMSYVQKELGTRVVPTIFAHEYPEEWGKTDDSIRMYARSIVDSVLKYNYDGLDLDYEPNYCGCNPYFKDKEKFKIFVSELGSKLGPQSKSGKLLIIDGEPDYMLPECGIYFDYAISQAYRTSNGASLQNRYNKIKTYFKPEQYIVTEEFEQLGATGGVNYTLPDGTIVPSLLGMAHWNPEEGRKGGAGAYIFNWDYSNNPSYRFVKQAIQIMNPHKKE